MRANIRCCDRSVIHVFLNVHIQRRFVDRMIANDDRRAMWLRLLDDWRPYAGWGSVR